MILVCDAGRPMSLEIFCWFLVPLGLFIFPMVVIGYTESVLRRSQERALDEFERELFG